MLRPSMTTWWLAAGAVVVVVAADANVVAGAGAIAGAVVASVGP